MEYSKSRTFIFWEEHVNSLNLFPDFVAEPVPGYESVTDKLMNVVAAFENLTPGVTMFRNLHSGVMFSLQSRLHGPYGIQSHGENYILIGLDDRLGKMGIRVNMGHGLLRRIEYITSKNPVWKVYLVDGYVELLLPSLLIDRMFPYRALLRT